MDSFFFQSHGGIKRNNNAKKNGSHKKNVYYYLKKKKCFITPDNWKSFDINTSFNFELLQLQFLSSFDT